MRPRALPSALRSAILLFALAAGCAEAPPTALGHECTADAECIPGAECSAEHACRCATGTLSCGGALCTDLATDRDNCGACGHACDDGASCVQGACEGDQLGTSEHALSINTPAYVYGTSATTTCQQEGETVASRVPANSQTLFFAAERGDRGVATTAWNTWLAKAAIPRSASVSDARGDAWTTYSTSNNLVYVSNIGVPTSGTPSSCLAVAGTTPDQLDNNFWAAPFVCAGNNQADQPAIAFDDGQNTFYAVSKNAGIRLDTFKNCTYVPGYSNCQRSSTTLFGPDTLRFGLDVNPCSNHAVVAYGSGTDLRLRFYDRDGVQHGASGGFLVASGQSWNGINAGCGHGTLRRCGLGTSDCKAGSFADDECMRDNARPSIQIKYRASDHRCYAAVAWDYTAAGSDGTTYVKNRFRLVDVTSESSPSVVSAYQSASNSFNWNQAYSYVTINDFSDNVGWFWVSDNQGACSAGWEGAVDTDLGISNISMIGKFSGTFPMVGFGAYAGIGDYAAGIKGGAPGGYLMPVWPQPVPTTASCRSCQGVQYSNAAKTTRILP